MPPPVRQSLRPSRIFLRTECGKHKCVCRTSKVLEPSDDSRHLIDRAVDDCISKSGRSMPKALKECASTKHLSWYYQAENPVNIIDDYVFRWFHQGFLGGSRIWTGVCDNAIHRSQRLEVKPLKSSDWPSDPLGFSWPSFPSITEWMEMLRKGVSPFERSGLSNPEGNTGYTSVSLGEIKENPFLATRIVANAIVGIRSSQEVPRKFLHHFRYRWNFLILTGTGHIPIGLVRFLIGQWMTNPYSLWLRRGVLFKKFLKKVPISHVLHARSRVVLDESHSSTPENGSCTPTALDQSDYESEGSSDLD